MLNTFTIPDWTPDEAVTVENCHGSWCTVLLNIVPAKIAGKWRAQNGIEVTLTQEYQMVTGTATPAGGQPVAVSGRLRGNDLTLSAAKQDFKGRVNGNVIEGTQTLPAAARTQPLTLTKVN